MARTVLLADDSVTAQNMGRRILMDAGYEVITVNNGSAALKKIHEHRPDLIVLDVYMPGYGGLEVCQRLKESPDTARIPVLLSVGKMEPFKADEAKRVRADGHIVKPFEASELLAALTKLEDRIVPPDSRDGRSPKLDKKGRTWQTEDSVVGTDDLRTERVAHLSEAKKRHASGASGEVAEAEVKQDTVAAASADQITDAAEVPAAVETPAVEASTIGSADTQEWVLGKSLFGKPVDGELALGESIFEKTVVVKASPSEAVSEVVASASAGVPRWVAESVGLTAEETSLDMDAEMQRSRAITAAVAIASDTSRREQVSASEVVGTDAASEVEAVSEAAFAAAASASATSVALGLSCQHSGFGVQPAVSPAQNDSQATAQIMTAASEVEVPVAHEAAAAWENWQQIRDSVMTPKKAEAIAEMATASTQAPAPVVALEANPNQDPTPSVIAAAAAAEEASSINDIVDSVLADMKPRLMAEIAKKLAAKK